MIRTSAIVTLALLSACGPPAPRGNADLDVRIRIEPDDPGRPPTRITVDVRNMGWQPVNGARVVLTRRLARAARPPSVDTVPGMGAGSYALTDPAFADSGRWIVTARVELTGGRWAEVDRVIELRPTGSEP